MDAAFHRPHGFSSSVAVVFAIAMNDYLDGALKQTLFKTSIFGYRLRDHVAPNNRGRCHRNFHHAVTAFRFVSRGQIATALTGVKIALILFVGLGRLCSLAVEVLHTFPSANVGGTVRRRC